MQIEIKEKISKRNIEGIIRAKTYKAGTFDKIFPIMEKARELLKEGKKTEACAMKANADKILKRYQIGEKILGHNLVMTAANIGTDLIIQSLNGFLVAPVYYCAINYGAVGTNATTPTATDIQLGTESARTPVSWSQDVSYNQLQLQFFFADGVLSNTTYYEFGSFVAANSAANSGQIFNHALFGTPYVKTSGVDTTIELDITI